VNVWSPSAEAKAGQAEGPGSRFLSFLGRFVALASARRRERRLRLCEMLALGDKRFVAVVEYGQEKFLLAGTPQNISLLHRMPRDGKETNEAPGAEPTLTEPPAHT
jgi:flagellar biogenesis protein FliO